MLMEKNKLQIRKAKIEDLNKMSENKNSVISKEAEPSVSASESRLIEHDFTLVIKVLSFHVLGSTI